MNENEVSKMKERKREMNDEAIIVGKPSKTTRAVILIIGCSLFCLGLILFLANFGECRRTVYTPDFSYYDAKLDKYVEAEDEITERNIFNIMFEMRFAKDSVGSYMVFAFLDLGLLLSIVGLIVYLALRKVSITVTPKRVTGRASFGRRVDLPVDEISAVGTNVFKTIVVATSSGRMRFQGIKNRDEIHKVISDLLIERQSKPKAVVQEEKPAAPSNVAEQLKQLKELVDAGILTQEEFDAKKKQLLGL